MSLDYVFTPPTVSEGPAGDDWLFSRYRLPRGITVLKSGGLYRQVRYPTQDDIAAADVAYMGGYDHLIDEDEAAALTAAGYGSHVTPISGGWGLHGYGEGFYGG